MDVPNSMVSQTVHCLLLKNRVSVLKGIRRSVRCPSIRNDHMIKLSITAGCKKRVSVFNSRVSNYGSGLSVIAGC